jgi:hypothetical protein
VFSCPKYLHLQITFKNNIPLLNKKKAQDMLNQMENLDTINVMVSTRDCTGVGIFDK